jgi:two-component SAPR family response regulator
VAAPGCLRASEQATTDARLRLAALRRACATYSGDLAQDHNYEWITPDRERARELALDPHRTPAATLGEQDPTEAARLPSNAVRIDPMAEHVYQQAMRRSPPAR